MDIELQVCFEFSCQKCGAPLNVKHKTTRLKEEIEVEPCAVCLIDAEIAGLQKASTTAQRVLDNALAK